MSVIEATATLFGIACVWLYVRQNIWSWPTGLVQVLLFIIVFYQARLYSDAALQVIYVGLQIYGWVHWTRGDKPDVALPVMRLSASAGALWVSVAAVGSLGWGYVMAHFTDAAAPYPDAFVAATSLVAQWLITRKKLESWLFWIAVDVVAVGVYLYKSLYLTTGLYVLFLVLAIVGYRSWRASVLRHTVVPYTVVPYTVAQDAAGADVGDARALLR